MIFLLFILALAATHPLQAQQPRYADTVMAGLSNEGKNLTDPYVTAADRAYLIGTQDGNFPDLGEHLPGEMGGLWVHPIKLIDGFFATVMDSATGQDARLYRSEEFINYPFGNRFRYGEVLDGLEIERFQFSPEGQPGVVVQYRFINSADRVRGLHLQLGVNPDLRPVWLSERLGIADAEDTVTWQATSRRFLARDTRHRWFAVWGATTPAGAVQVSPPAHPSTRTGVTAVAAYHIPVAAKDTATITFVFAGSTRSSAEANAAFTHIARNHPQLLERKKAHYASLLTRARIRIPDQKLQQVYDWVRINNEWMVRDVPGIGRGLGAGLMEYPWWFGTDGAYSLHGVIPTGDFALVKQTLRLLREQSAKANGNGRIIHEVTTNGAVYNPGNTQETAHFIMTVAKTVRWTGDLAFAREMYPAMKQGLRWLLTEMDPDQNLFPGGYGITEIYGLNAELIDVAVYTQQALLATAEVARLLGDGTSAARYERRAEELKRRINERFWLGGETSYADFYGTRDQAVGVTEGAIQQISQRVDEKPTAEQSERIDYYQQLRAKFAAMPDTSRGWITNKNWVVATPMETGIAPRERALQVLERIRQNDVGEYGPFLSAVDRQAMMTISTGVLAVAEAQYGRMDQSLWYMNRIVETFGRKLPGSISEMMPDYGDFVQAWTIYGIVVPLVEHIFGIRPDAVQKTITFEPRLPRDWEDIAIEDLPVGTNLISFTRRKTDRGIEYRIEGRESGWRFVLKEKPLPGARFYLNGKPAVPDLTGIRMTARNNQVLIVTE
jgi:glycogen debranching enzyme